MQLRILALALLAAAPAAGAIASADPETRLIQAINQIESGKLQDARAALDQLVKEQPNFRLARLFQGELAAALSGQPLPVASRMKDDEKRALMDEARLRLWQPPVPEGREPAALMQLAGRTSYALAVDLSHARLYLLEHRDGELKVLRDFYAASGKSGAGKEKSGDNRTPVGVYHLTGFIPDAKLPDFYGAGAFKTNYPNDWDRLQHRDGHGIWLHGVPRDTYSRAPRSSEGCVTLSNEDLLSLKPYVQPGVTPVVFAESLVWVKRDQLGKQRDALLEQIEQWRDRWSALDTEAYLAFYAEDFTADGMGRKAFAQHKRRVNAGKKSVSVRLSDVELFRYPGADDLVLARFTQDYRSSNLARVTSKEQFWRREQDGAWRIVRETSG
ncbi:MAG TPA: L,D-transpeptidase family protein [Candidatus Binatia bacterium]|nr:L,D-transpeptidase family protein [Candidatus Binatia bacterium]